MRRRIKEEIRARKRIYRAREIVVVAHWCALGLVHSNSSSHKAEASAETWKINSPRCPHIHPKSALKQTTLANEFDMKGHNEKKKRSGLESVYIEPGRLSS
jgi:hypothetical protein